MSLNISLNKRYLRQSSETFERMSLGEVDGTETWYGRNWAGPPVTFENFRRITDIETFETYGLDYTGPFNAGDGWDDEAVTYENFARLIGWDDANGYSVGSGDSPYSGGVNLPTPTINNVDIVTILGADRGFQVANGGIAWDISSLPAWQVLQIGCLVHIPATAVTGLGADTLRIGVCHTPAAAPGIVADGSVAHALFWRSVGWSYAAASGTMQAAASNSAQLGRIVSGTGATANITTISRVGAISSAPAVVRCPIVLTITKGSPNFTLAIARRTTTTTGPGFDRDEALISAATESGDPAGVMGAQHNQHSQTIAIDEGANGALNTVFLAFASSSPSAYFSGVWIARRA